MVNLSHSEENSSLLVVVRPIYYWPSHRKLFWKTTMMKYNTNSENKNEGHNSMGPFSLVFHLQVPFI